MWIVRLALRLPYTFVVMALLMELRQLATQYSLGYPTSSHDDKAFRRVAVRILPPAYGVARTRSGYVAASE